MGLMSGTSADGVDVALARIGGAPPHLDARLENFRTIPFPAGIRADILRVAEGQAVTAGEISDLNFRLGEIFAAAVRTALGRFRVSLGSIDLIGSHGQTVFHSGVAARVAGHKRVASTLQIGEAAIIAERTGVPVAADFRPGDIAAGGQGAPLVPFADYLLLRDLRIGRVALNLGGIANVTIIPAAALPKDVVAFDTGPANMVTDALMGHYTRGKLTFDRGGSMARRGCVLPDLLRAMLRHPFFAKQAPKTAGREQFGREFVETILARTNKSRARPEDVIRTALELTAASVAKALRPFPKPRNALWELIVSGGGASNPVLMARLTELLPELRVLPSDEVGIPSQAKEALAFALLAYEAWHGRANSLPSATGARHAAVLGKIIRP
jgi:anhydro-N-acetylmuramic acid kinase